MAMHNPPYYRYPLLRKWDKEAFLKIKEIGKIKNYPKISGSENDKNQFLITLIRTQKSLHDWRDFLKEILKQIDNGNIINTAFLNKKYPPESIGKDIPEWVTYRGDKIVNDFIDTLETKNVNFIGTDKDISEFIIRFILGQLGHDWEQTIMMIWEILGNGNKLIIKDLNDEMKNFDYLNLFL